MTTNLDLQSLWNQQEVSPPNVQEILASAKKFKRKNRNKIVFQYISLIATLLIIGRLLISHTFELTTSTVGILLIIVAVSFYLIVSSKLLKVLFKSNLENNNSAYLNQLIELKQKQESLQTNIISIYFILLSLGLLLYLIEFALQGGWVFGCISYGLTGAWVAFNWFYLRPRGIKKQHAEINRMIDQLKTINKQLNEVETEPN